VALVGALIVDRDHRRLYIQRRSASRKVFPGAWDIVGGKVEPGEDRETALAREMVEETGWTLESILGWCFDDRTHLGDHVAREQVAVVTVDDPDRSPRLEPGKAVEWAWVGPDDAVADQNIVDGWGDHIPKVLAAGFAFLQERAVRDI
jgi:8-oxo-dGTP pyrophosphatase MutT (NUDIX family)